MWGLLLRCSYGYSVCNKSNPFCRHCYCFHCCTIAVADAAVADAIAAATKRFCVTNTVGENDSYKGGGAPSSAVWKRCVLAGLKYDVKQTESL